MLAVDVHLLFLKVKTPDESPKPSKTSIIFLKNMKIHFVRIWSTCLHLIFSLIQFIFNSNNKTFQQRSIMCFTAKCTKNKSLNFIKVRKEGKVADTMLIPSLILPLTIDFDIDRFLKPYPIKAWDVLKWIPRLPAAFMRKENRLNFIVGKRMWTGPRYG